MRIWARWFAMPMHRNDFDPRDTLAQFPSEDGTDRLDPRRDAAGDDRKGREAAPNASDEAREGWRSQFTALMWWASAIALVAFSGGLMYSTAIQVHRLTRVLPPEPPEVVQDIVIRNVPDGLGRRTSFRILLFSDEFRWRLNSSSVLESGLSQPVFTDEMKAVLNDTQEIICVGASSEELPPSVTLEQGGAAEERRAARRAEQIAIWMREAVSRPIPIRKLNIGHHAPTGQPGDTSDQRRVIIILVLDSDDNIHIDEALRTAMVRESARAPIFDTLLTQYSLAEGTSFAWVE